MTEAAQTLKPTVKVFVAKIPYAMTGQELFAVLNQRVLVQEAYVITDRETGRSRGFGFAVIEGREEDRPWELLDGIEVEKNGSGVAGSMKLVVKPANEKPQSQRGRR